MEREIFLAKLEELARKASEGDDPVVVRSAAVLMGLLGSIYGGDGFFDAYADACEFVTKNQLAIILELKS